MSGAKSRTRAGLSRERVLQAAMEAVDAAGLEALTMRRLAQELGVEAMTLYYYVANKDEILDGIVDRVVGQFELPSPEEDWKRAIRRSAISAHAVLLRHPWSASLLLSAPRVSTARLRYMDALLATLRRAGFSPRVTDRAYHALDSHIMGHTLWLVGIAAGAAHLQGGAAGFLERLDKDAFPHLADHARQHLEERPRADEGDFAFGLDLILDGLERLREAP